jgi:V-type H+-transporting ATPase subunit A
MSEYDRYSPFYKTTGMLRNFIAYYEAAQKAVESGDVAWNKIRESTADEWYQLSQVRYLLSLSLSYLVARETDDCGIVLKMKFENPKDGEENIKKSESILQPRHSGEMLTSSFL